VSFPIVLSHGPPAARLGEVAAAGVSHIRLGHAGWNEELVEGQVAAERAQLDAAAAHGVLGWVWLGKVREDPLLTRIVNGLKGHPGLGAWKGWDEPAWGKVPAAPLVRAYKRIKQLDPKHPVVIIQAPRGSVAELSRYRGTFDITGADIYPVSYPPGAHARRKRRDLGLVGDVTRTMAAAAGRKPIWTTLQIAWSGVLPPGHVPRFPSLHDERFMAYAAIVGGARGLVFFGGHLTQVMSPADAKAGWNWTFWEQALRPVVAELRSLEPALTAANVPGIKSGAADVELVARRAGGFLYVIAVRRGGQTSTVGFTGLPRSIRRGEVMFEWANGSYRDVEVQGGGFRDWLGPYDVRVYRFRTL
jgi:hypothetical protein